MSENDARASQADLDDVRRQTRLLDSIRRRVQGLTVAVVLMALALFLEVVAVFGYLIEFHAGEYLLVAATAVGTAVLGFFFGLGVGWFVQRK